MVNLFSEVRQIYIEILHVLTKKSISFSRSIVFALLVPSPPPRGGKYGILESWNLIESLGVRRNPMESDGIYGCDSSSSFEL